MNTTGVVYSVSAWLTIRPPTMVIPSGWRNSEPSPVPKASGSARRAGGHHDRTEAQKASLLDRLAGIKPPPLRRKREVDHHDRVLFDDADEQQHADRRDDGELGEVAR